MSQVSQNIRPRARGPHGLEYTWKRKPLRKEPEPSKWQRDCYEGPTREYERNVSLDHDPDLAVHYMNRRYVSEVIGTKNEDTRVDENDSKAVRDKKTLLRKLQAAKPDVTIRYYHWDIEEVDETVNGGFGYFVRINYGPSLSEVLADDEFHIKRVVDKATGWWERLLPVDAPFSSEYNEPGRNEKADIEVCFYNFGQGPADRADQRDRFFRADPQINVFKAYSLRTAREANRLYADLRLSKPIRNKYITRSNRNRPKPEEKDRELLVHLPPNGSERRRMSHWADIKQTTVLHPGVLMDRTISNRTHCCEAIVDWDISSLHYMNWEDRKLRMDRTSWELRWEEGKHEDWERMRLESTSEAEIQKTEFWVEFEGNQEQERRLWAYCEQDNQWYTVEDRRKVHIVNHVRAEIEVKEGMVNPNDQRWDAVESGFDGSKNPVYLFCLSDSYGTLVDRMIVKPSIRDPTSERYDDLNDAFGMDTSPREVFINKIVNGMDDDARDLFTDCFHYSFRYLKGVETWFLYLAYEDGGSLASLQRSHLKEVHRIDKANPNHPRPDIRVYLPEIFVWCVFERLVRACYALRKEQIAINEHNGLVHHDLKPSNILLRKRPGPHYENVHNIKRNKRDLPARHPEPPVRHRPIQSVDRAYPIPLLADLEFCYALDHGQIRNTIGTPGFIAPEQYGPYPASPLRTDIFQIGCVLYSLMRNQTQGLIARNSGGETLRFGPRRARPGQPDFVSLDPQEFDVRGSIARDESDQSFGRMYSQNLTRLVDWCLQKHATDRPDISRLMREVREGLQAYDESLGRVLERKTGDPRVHPWFAVEHRKDQFEEGSSLVGKKKHIRPPGYGGRNMTMWDPYGGKAKKKFTHWEEGVYEVEGIEGVYEEEGIDEDEEED